MNFKKTLSVSQQLKAKVPQQLTIEPSQSSEGFFAQEALPVGVSLN